MNKDERQIISWRAGSALEGRPRRSVVYVGWISQVFGGVLGTYRLVDVRVDN